MSEMNSLSLSHIKLALNQASFHMLHGGSDGSEFSVSTIILAQVVVDLSEKLDALSAKIDRMAVQMQTLSYNGDE